MNERQQLLAKNAGLHRQEMFEAERWLWRHPQTGYTEWEANAYLIEKFEAAGYTLVRADQDPRFGPIPGFYTDIDTGRPGPSLCIMGELDALDIAGHPEAVNGMSHCCGHNCQAAGMLGLALAFKGPGALDGLSGRIRLMLVPAEEMIQLAYREELRKKGVIRYFGGKPEFMYRGYFDGIDISLMVHTESLGKDLDFLGFSGHNGCMSKVITYKGKSSHAGGAPHLGINAQYAAMLGLQAVNDLRETFLEKDFTRFHPIMKGVNCAVNIIPDEMVIESYVRGSSLEAMVRENGKINRALAGGALAMGAQVDLSDRPGYAPEMHDMQFSALCEEACRELVGEKRVDFPNALHPASSDFGDVCAVMPGMQFYCAGAEGAIHGTGWYITEPERAVMNAVVVQLMITDKLMSDDCARAKKIIREHVPQFASVKEYFETVDRLMLDVDALAFEEDGRVRVRLTNS